MRKIIAFFGSRGVHSPVHLFHISMWGCEEMVVFDGLGLRFPQEMKGFNRITTCEELRKTERWLENLFKEVFTVSFHRFFAFVKRRDGYVEADVWGRPLLFLWKGVSNVKWLF